MYSEQKKEEQVTLQTSGKEKPDKKKAKVSQANLEPAPDKEKVSHRSSKRKLKYYASKGRRQYYQTRSKR